MFSSQQLNRDLDINLVSDFSGISNMKDFETILQHQSEVILLIGRIVFISTFVNEILTLPITSSQMRRSTIMVLFSPWWILMPRCWKIIFLYSITSFCSTSQLFCRWNFDEVYFATSIDSGTFLFLVDVSGRFPVAVNCPSNLPKQLPNRKL